MPPSLPGTYLPSHLPPPHPSGLAGTGRISSLTAGVFHGFDLISGAPPQSRCCCSNPPLPLPGRNLAFFFQLSWTISRLCSSFSCNGGPSKSESVFLSPLFPPISQTQAAHVAYARKSICRCHRSRPNRPPSSSRPLKSINHNKQAFPFVLRLLVRPCGCGCHGADQSDYTFCFTISSDI